MESDANVVACDMAKAVNKRAMSRINDGGTTSVPYAMSYRNKFSNSKTLRKRPASPCRKKKRPFRTLSNVQIEKSRPKIVPKARTMTS